MQRFKKRLRLLTQKHGGDLGYAIDGSLLLSFSTGSACISALSYDAMQCDINLGDTAFPLRASKDLVFDIAARLASPHLMLSLRTYCPGSILTLQNYIDDESGESRLHSLRERITLDPSLDHDDLGGNRINAEYYHGVLILYDDLCSDATNVIDFAPKTGG